MVRVLLPLSVATVSVRLDMLAAKNAGFELRQLAGRRVLGIPRATSRAIGFALEVLLPMSVATVGMWARVVAL